MGSFSIFHWLVVAFFMFLTIYPMWRIAQKAGYHGAWSLTMLVPIVNFIFIWVFALTKWPNER